MINIFKENGIIHFPLNYLHGGGLSLTMIRIGIFYLGGIPRSKTLLKHSYG